MKKFKLNVKKKVPAKDVWLFSDRETLAIWLIDFSASFAELADLPEATHIVIHPEDKVEIEWMGCEFLYTENKPIRFDLIKVVKASPPYQANKKGLVLTGYSGWVVDELLLLRHNVKNSDVCIKRINEDQSEILMPPNEHMVHSQMIDNVSKIMKSLNLPKV
jgi:hypothetical protein